MRPTPVIYLPVLLLAALTTSCSDDAPASPQTSGTSSGGTSTGTTSSSSTSSSTTSTSSSTTSPPCTPGEQASCYDGPAGTANVGLCAAGTHTCGNDGSFGACVGEVLPATEDCGTPLDEDCDGQTPPCPPPVGALWSRAFGTTGDDRCYSTAIDAAGAVYLTCNFQGTIDLGSGPVTSASPDFFLVKLDAAGKVAWAKVLGGPGTDMVGGVAVVPSGGVVLAGAYVGTTDFGGGPLAAVGEDVFVVRLDADGNHVWSKQFGGPNAQMAYTIATSATGAIAIAGEFVGSLDFGSGPIASASGSDAYVALLDPNGSLLFVRSFPGPGPQIVTGVAVGVGGDVFVTGAFGMSIDLGSGPAPSAGGKDVFVAKLDPQGKTVFGRTFGGKGDQMGHGIAADPDGGAVFVGDFANSIDFGGGPLTSAGLADAFVAKVDAAGAHVYSHGYGSAGVDLGSAVAIDAAGSARVGGFYAGAVNFGGGTFHSFKGGADAFVVQLDPAGAHLRSSSYGTTGGQGIYGIRTSAAGVAVAGYFTGALDFGQGALPNKGGYDFFVARLPP